MLLLISRLFLFLLLVADWAGDPYFGQSPLSRPFSSQDAFCHSFVQRANLLKATTIGCIEDPVLHAQSDTLAAVQTPGSPPRAWELEHVLLRATGGFYALMSMRC